MHCITHLLEGKRYLCGSVTALLVDKFFYGPIEKVVKVRNLTRREYEIAQYLSEGMKLWEIAKKIDRHASTISTIKKTIFSKLEVDSVMKLHKVLSVSLSRKAV